VKTWLLVAAERREFDGIRKRVGNVTSLSWASLNGLGAKFADGKFVGVKFAIQAQHRGDRWWMIANGPGRELVEQAMPETAKQRVTENVSGIISTGLCGALDPALRAGDIVVDGLVPSTSRRYVRGGMHSLDHVAVTSKEKRILRNQTGAIAVDMETAAVRDRAAAWNIPFYCVRVVSDCAGEDLPLDFNRYREGRGDFSRIRIALAALASPISVLPRLMEFDKNCRQAADILGEFLADCQF
jgi:adenosylhomocysteine nucleosidase